MTTDLTLYLRDPARRREGQLDDYQKITLNPKLNAVGKWVLTLDRRAPLAAQLTVPGYGIEAVRAGTTVMSGMLLHRQHVKRVDQNTIEVHGVDDNIWLERTLAHPQPSSTVPPYNVSEYDVRTGVCSTILRQYVDINRGPSAIANRRIPGLTMATDPVIGSTVSGRARWQPLLELLQELAISGGQIGFRMAQVGTALQFTVYPLVDRTATITFSEQNGTLAGFDYSADAPEATYIYCGGGGEGTARTIKEGGDSELAATWGRWEKFRDRRDTTDSTEMDQAITDELVNSGEKTGLSLTPIDTDGQSYGTHYGMGDRVTAVIDGVEIQESVREVVLTYTPSGPQTVVPVIGTPGTPAVLGVFAAVKDALSRTRRLERR